MEHCQGSEIDWTIEAYQHGQGWVRGCATKMPYSEMVKRFIRL